MNLKHLIQAYKFNKIKTKVTKEINDNEKAGVINFNDNINAAYLLNNKEMIIALNIFCNCITKELTINSQINHTIEVIKILQKSIELISNITTEETNLILKSLGIFDNTFQKRKENKTLKLYL